MCISQSINLEFDAIVPWTFMVSVWLLSGCCLLKFILSMVGKTCHIVKVDQQHSYFSQCKIQKITSPSYLPRIDFQLLQLWLALSLIFNSHNRRLIGSLTFCLSLSALSIVTQIEVFEPKDFKLINLFF